MQIRPTGKLKETSKDAGNTIAKFQGINLQNRNIVNH